MPPRALEDIARLVDAAVSSPGLLFGSLPPTARDLDPLLRPADHRAAAAGLADSGFERHGESWARFADCSATVVDLVPTHEWALPCAEEEALFAEALPLEGCRRLVRPAPHHAVLILARRLVRSRGGLDARRRERAERAVAEDADVWRRARRHAPAWGATRALALLERVVGGGGKPAYRERAGALREETHGRLRLAGARAWKAAAPRLPRGGGVALSGLDGAGKSTQAESLRTTLEALGREAVVVWRPLGQSPVLNLIAKPVKRVLSVLRFGAFAAAAERSATGSVMAAGDGSEGSRAGSATRMAWTTIVALVNAASLRGRGGSPPA